MAAALSLVTLEEELTCAICLGIYTDPVVLECKHSFCRACIEEFWSGAAPGTYSCPECRAETSERPGLEKNFKLASIVQKYLALQSSQDAVLCNYCTESPLPAIKTCLKCEASLCPIHLKHHRENSVFKSHSLTELTTDLSLWKCPEHQKSLEIYCKDDKVCVCSLCALVGKHKNHNCSSISEGEKELRDHLQCQLERIRSNTEAVQAALNLHHKEKQNTQSEIQEAKCKVKEKYKLLKKSVEEEERKVLERLENEEKRVTEQTNTKIFQLENQLKESETSLAALTSVLKQNEELVFIQEFNSMPDRMKDLSQLFIPLENMSDVDKAIQQNLKVWVQKLDSVPSKTYRNFLSDASHRSFLVIMYGQTPGSNIRSSFPKQTPCNYRGTRQQYGQNPYGLQSMGWQQFMCCQGVSCGRSYWEVQIDITPRGNVGYRADVLTQWGVGVCFQTPGARCTEWSITGYGPVEDKRSWILHFSSGSLTAQHNGEKPNLMVAIPSKVGVFVDFEAGIISFYSVSGNNLTLLHTFQEQRFLEPLYPALWVYDCDVTLTYCYLMQ
uniref:E3 ubiquitin/ISG15 ligase TRIM25-like protein n=1 Tax=Callorhinchus milii TaxID=7868 RepID=V9KJH7_CALMI